MRRAQQQGVCFHDECQHPERDGQCYESERPSPRAPWIAIIVIMCAMLGIGAYMMLSVIGVPVPFPEWYEKAQKEQVDEMMKNDPVLKLGDVALELRKERDSLQHVVDSLESK